MHVTDLLSVKKPEIRALHLTWMAFFVCFYTWFNFPPLATTILQQLKLTKQEIDLLAICNVALTIPARLIVGMALDKWGPRRVFSSLMILMSFPAFFFAFGNTLTQLLIARLILGCIGAGFVVGMHMITLWFPPKDVGFASGIYGGWGNFGIAIAAMSLPLLALHLFGGPEGWRYAIATSGTVTLLYGIYYGRAITDGPSRGFVYRPRKVTAIEVSQWSDMIKLVICIIPIIGVLALFVQKIQRMGYMGTTTSWTAYFLIFAAILYQIIQILKVNLPILRKGVPKDDVYPFNSVAALALNYFTNFGGALAVVSILPLFLERLFHISPTLAGFIAASFPFLNLVSRPTGGWLADRMESRRKVILAYTLGVAFCFTVMGMINDRWPLEAVVMAILLTAAFVDGGAGATFATIPLIKKRLTGQITGIVGAYGNIGAMIYLVIYATFGAERFFFAMAGGALISFVACLFFLQEPKAAFAGEYHLSSVDRDIEGEAYLGNLKEEPTPVEPVTPLSPAGEEPIQMEVAWGDTDHSRR